MEVNAAKLLQLYAEDHTGEVLNPEIFMKASFFTQQESNGCDFG